MEPVTIDFVTASAKWMDEPFPAGSANDEIDEVHAELVGGHVGSGSRNAVPDAKDAYSPKVLASGQLCSRCVSG